jgi:hypothetical protein
MTTIATTRRSLLARLGVAAVLAGGTGANVLAIVATRPAAAAVPLAPLASPLVSPTEDPSLIALGEEFDRLAAAWEAADTRYREARAEAERIAPELPADLRVVDPMPAHLRRGWRYARDVEGKELPWPKKVGPDGTSEVYRPPRVLFADRLENECLPAVRPRSKAAKDIRRRIAAAEQYEAAVKAAAEASGLPDARQEREWAATDLEGVVWKIGRATSRTLDGVLIQARAVATLDRIEQEKRPDSPFRKGALAAGSSLADAVLRLVATGRA